MWKIILWIIGLSHYGAITQDFQMEKCSSCMSNYAYCINDKEFFLCLDKENPISSGQPLSCDEGEFCTNSQNICEAISAITGPIRRVCSNGNTCGDCSNSKITCVSRTQVAYCLGTQNQNSILSQCPDGQFCSMDLYNAHKKFCASQIVLDFYGYTITCPNDSPIVPTPEPTTTTPNANDLKLKCENALVLPNNSYFIINDNDLSCKSYIYCEVNNGVMYAILLTCSSGYYDTELNRCVTFKPSTCPTAAGSTTTSTTAAPDTTESQSTATETISVSENVENSENVGNTGEILVKNY